MSSDHFVHKSNMLTETQDCWVIILWGHLSRSALSKSTLTRSLIFPRSTRDQLMHTMIANHKLSLLSLILYHKAIQTFTVTYKPLKTSHKNMTRHFWCVLATWFRIFFLVTTLATYSAYLAARLAIGPTHVLTVNFFKGNTWGSSRTVFGFHQRHVSPDTYSKSSEV